ncbi:Exosome complex component RRP42 [Rhynchospora pubera]|uniref:Ribosomal RNA-processing protein 42 n=1 Tax=Rhynchospora pubera TaxID=906938 RepID=A0AAV8C3Q4_9POAL|nr:Exosome complex component RRP42 [Rhynchospora pubera]
MKPDFMIDLYEAIGPQPNHGVALFLSLLSSPLLSSAPDGCCSNKSRLKDYGGTFGRREEILKGGIEQNLRADGRTRNQFRPISVETGIIPQANGSARVRLGATEVIASIKAELGKPSVLHPDKGKVSIFVDCSPTAAPVYEGKGGEELSMELSVALERCLLGGKSGAGAAIDLSSLVLVEGKVCWDLYIDALVVSSDGNLLDSLAAAIKAALSNTGLPKVNVVLGASPEEQPEVDVSDEEFLQFDTSTVPVIVTLTKVGNWEAVHCRCHIRGRVTDELSRFGFSKQERPDMWFNEERRGWTGPKCNI